MADDVSIRINSVDFILFTDCKECGEGGTKIETLVNKLTHDYWINLCVCTTMGAHCWEPVTSSVITSLGEFFLLSSY